MNWKNIIGKAVGVLALIGGPIAPVAQAISGAINHAEEEGGDGQSKKQQVIEVARTSIESLGVTQAEISEDLLWLLDDVVEAELRYRETYARILRVVEKIKGAREP